MARSPVACGQPACASCTGRPLQRLCSASTSPSPLCLHPHPCPPHGCRHQPQVRLQLEARSLVRPPGQGNLQGHLLAHLQAGQRRRLACIHCALRCQPVPPLSGMGCRLAQRRCAVQACPQYCRCRSAAALEHLQESRPAGRWAAHATRPRRGVCQCGSGVGRLLRPAAQVFIPRADICQHVVDSPTAGEVLDVQLDVKGSGEGQSGIMKELWERCRWAAGQPGAGGMGFRLSSSAAFAQRLP